MDKREAQRPGGGEYEARNAKLSSEAVGPTAEEVGEECGGAMVLSPAEEGKMEAGEGAHKEAKVGTGILVSVLDAWRDGWVGGEGEDEWGGGGAAGGEERDVFGCDGDCDDDGGVEAF